MCVRVHMHVFVCVCAPVRCGSTAEMGKTAALRCRSDMLVVPPDAPQSLIRMLKKTLRLFFGDKVRRAERQRCRTSATVTRLKNNRHNVTGLGCK